MPVFSYQAVDRSGRRVVGTLAADTAAAARRALREQGARPLEFRRTRFQRPSIRSWIGEKRRQELIAEFARQMALLLRTGVPVVDALDVLIRQHRGPILPVLRDLRDRVAAGASLSNALECHARWFDGVFCSSAKVGQLSGNLEQALTHLSSYMLERQTLRHRLFMALAYPAVLAVLGTAVSIFLMSYVVPQLLHVLQSTGRGLPAATAALKAISDTLVGHWLALGASALLICLGALFLWRWKRGRLWIHEWQLQVPLLGVLVRKSVVAQFSQMMALLLRSGVTFVEALRLARESCRNEVLARELADLEAAIVRGSDIAVALAGTRIFPPLVSHVFNVGQKTGELPEMLAQLSDGYGAEVRVAISKFSTALEPVLIVLMSAIVGFVVFATMTPILEVTRSIQ